MDYRAITFGGGASSSLLHPIVLVMLLIAVPLIFALPRKKVVIPVLAMMFLVPLTQQIYVGGVHLFVLRLVILAALVRSGLRMSGGWNSIDKVFTLHILFQTGSTLLNYSGAFINQLGFIWDCLGGYVIFRSFIEDEEDVHTALKCVAVLVGILATSMIYENITVSNTFGQLGGVPLRPEVRDGRTRSQGVFQHALTAGAFATTALPLLFMMWKRQVSKGLAMMGMIGATAITLTTSTSTALLSLMAVGVSLLAWFIRKHIRTVRWAGVVVVLALSVVMSAPVWFIIARVDLTGSSSSYQRALLVDQFINNFDKWYLTGSNTSTWGWDMWDVQNQFVSVGTGGGLAAFLAFVLVITRCLSRIAKARKAATNRSDEWMFWMLSSTMFVVIVTFFGVNFFDQVRELFYAFLAMIIVLTAPKAIPSAVAAPAPFSTGQKRAIPVLRT